METTYQKAIQAARRYLELKGFEILEDGWCHGKDTIDFIATGEDGELVFISCEVNANAGEASPTSTPIAGRLNGWRPRTCQRRLWRTQWSVSTS